MKRIYLPLFLLAVLICACGEDRPRTNPFDSKTDLSPDEWAPTNLQAEVLNDSEIKLTWTQEKTPISGFKLSRKTGNGSLIQIAELSANVSEYTDTGLSIDTDYTYRLKAFTDVNESNNSETTMNLYYDCLSVFMGTAAEDCSGECNGTAFENACDNCVGGNSGVDENNCGIVMDIDGNEYATVIIGNQVWMAENLKVSKYRDGSAIPTGHSDNDWMNLSTGAYSVYDNTESNADTYGYLYNWYAVDDSRNIAPAGWHVATDAEWTTLTDYLGGTSVAGGKMKETGTSHWNSPNTGATNESGFTAFPGGYRHYNNGKDYDIGSYGYFWSSSEVSSNSAWGRRLYYNNSEVYRNNDTKKRGCSVRCVRD